CAGDTTSAVGGSGRPAAGDPAVGGVRRCGTPGDESVPGNKSAVGGGRTPGAESGPGNKSAVGGGRTPGAESGSGNNAAVGGGRGRRGCAGRWARARRSGQGGGFRLVGGDGGGDGGCHAAVLGLAAAAGTQPAEHDGTDDDGEAREHRPR